MTEAIQHARQPLSRGRPLNLVPKRLSAPYLRARHRITSKPMKRFLSPENPATVAIGLSRPHKVIVTSPLGEERILAILGPGAIAASSPSSIGGRGQRR